MPSNMVGEIQFARVDNRPVEPAETVEVLTAAGVAGYGARKGPQQGRTRRLFARGYYDTAEDAYAGIAEVRALRSTVVTVYDARGEEHAGCLVVDAEDSGGPRFCWLVVPGEGLVEQEYVDYVIDVIKQVGSE